MPTFERQHILDELRRTADENGGKSLGRTRFEQLTGISQHDVYRYWPRFSDAVREAGLSPNRLNPARQEDELLERFVQLVRKLGHIPTRNEMRLERRWSDPTFPSPGSYDRFGTKHGLIARSLDYCARDDALSDVLDTLRSFPRSDADSGEDSSADGSYGFVYLVRGHRGEYKIGRTNLVDRRLSELGPLSAVEQVLIHEIKTDDPAGVEAYWHRRFADKRMRGEWFRLMPSDVKAFKRWRRIS